MLLASGPFLQITEIMVCGISWASQRGDITTDVGDAVIQDLQDVLAVVGKCTWIFLDPLVVVGCTEQTRRPGSITIVAS